tara:strand:+ start:1977 stop:2735 length:759 start_codon:yes stop_codon:yes gene_type:complete
MLKKRIIPLLLISNDRLIKPIKFTEYRDVGDPTKTAQIYSDSDADELIILNIDRKKKKIDDLTNHLNKIVEKCFVPISAGGGVESLEDAVRIIKSGADKIVLNSICYKKKDILQRIVQELGSQAVVASIDIKILKNQYVLFSENGKKKIEDSLKKHLDYLNTLKVGEIFVNSVDLEGTMLGPDNQLIKVIKENTDLPIIYSGGIGNYDHIKSIFQSFDINAVACGSIFNFTDTNPIRLKSYLNSHKLNLRIF